MTYLNDDYFTEKVASNYRLDEFIKNPKFMMDAITFLRSERLNFDNEDINEMSDMDIVDRVQKHFRFSASNPTTIVKDLAFMDRDTVPDSQKEAYARLNLAFDNTKSEGVGEAASDYFVSEVVNPVNWVSLVAGAFTGGTASVAIREAVKKGGVQVAKESIKQLNKKALRNSLLKGGLGSATVEGGLSYYNEKARTEAGEYATYYDEKSGEIVNYEQDFDWGRVALETGAATVLGTALGGGSGLIQNKKAVEVIDNWNEGYRKRLTINAEADERADDLLKGLFKEGYTIVEKSGKDGKILKKVVKEKILKGELTKDNTALKRIANSLAELDPDRVMEGEDIIKGILGDDPSFAIGSIKLDRIKRLTAAAYEISQLKGIPKTKTVIENGEEVVKHKRITEILADALDATDQRYTLQFKDVIDLLKKYKLEPSELSALYMAEFSEAGKVLREAGRIKQADQKALYDKAVNEIEKLNNSRFISITPEQFEQSREAREIFSGDIALKLLRWANDSRIAMMTTQTATTARNASFGGVMVVFDAMEKTIEETVRRLGGKGSEGSFLANPLAIAKNMYTSREQALVITEMLEDRMPVEIKQLFNKSAQAEIEGTSSPFFKNPIVNGMANFATHFNVANAFADHQFKRAVLVGTIDRLLREKGSDEVGRSIEEVMRKGTWDKINQEYIELGIQEAFRFSMQSQFGLKGEAGASFLAQKGINGFKKWIIPTALIAFPRYVASQMQWINDYMPLSALVRLDDTSEALVPNLTGYRPIAPRKNLTKTIKTLDEKTGKTVEREVLTPPITKKSHLTAWSRNAVGAIPIGLGYYQAAEKHKEGNDTFELSNPADGTKMNIQASLGPAALHYMLGDLLWKMTHVDTRSVIDWGQKAKEIGMVSIGTDFRAGSNYLYDLALGVQDEKKFQRALADLVSPLLYPLSTINDIYSQFNTRSSFRPEVLDPSSSQLYNENVFILDWMGNDFDVWGSSLRNRVQKFWLDLSDQSWLPYTANEQEDYLDIEAQGFEALGIESDYSILDGYDPRYFTPFARNPLYLQDPMLKQLFGVTSSAPNSELLAEMNRLDINQYTVYSRDHKSNFLDIVTRMSLSSSLPDEFVFEKMHNTNYKKMTAVEKKAHLETWIKDKVKEKKEFIRQLAEKGQLFRWVDTDRDMVSYVRGEISRLKKQKAFDSWAKRHNKRTIEERFNLITGINTHNFDMEVMSDNKNKLVTILPLYIDLLKDHKQFWAEVITKEEYPAEYESSKEFLSLK